MPVVAGNFLCGCNPASKKHYSGDTRKSPIPGADPIYTDKRLDASGYEVCPEHGERLYGYASPQTERSGLGRVIDYTRLGSGGSVRLVEHEDIEDMRDNRDPEEVYLQLKADRIAKKSAGNGHG